MNYTDVLKTELPKTYNYSYLREFKKPKEVFLFKIV